jgi:hypothetical protein
MEDIGKRQRLGIGGMEDDVIGLRGHRHTVCVGQKFQITVTLRSPVTAVDDDDDDALRLATVL